MTVLVGILSLVLIASSLVTLALLVRRKEIFDRIIGVGVVGTKTSVLLAYIGLMMGRPDAFVDIALTYALLNFLVTIAVARYFTWSEMAK